MARNPLSLNRRQFFVGLAGVTTAAGWREAHAALDARFDSLKAAMEAARFDPRAPKNFTAVWTSDTHFGHGDPEKILAPIVAEVNAMEPLPAFFAITGDTIISASLSFGQIPDEKQKQKAIAEFRLLKSALERFDPRVPVKLALGNHDTYVGESDAALFHKVFPDRPAYQAFEIKGVTFVFLNGGSCGRFDDAQRAWFRKQVARFQKTGGTLVTGVHQPSLGNVVVERGIPEAFRETLADCHGELWMVAGHSHRNADTCFRLPHAVITQAEITTPNPAIWCGGKERGWWIYCFAGGRLAARVFHRSDGGYALASAPALTKARHIRLPFEGQTDVLWKVMVGDGDHEYAMDTRAAWCENYWTYVKHLDYRFPLSLADGRATRVAVLTERDNCKLSFSSDGTIWEKVPATERNGNLTSFVIPEACLQLGMVKVRVEGGEVGGFALLK